MDKLYTCPWCNTSIDKNLQDHVIEKIKEVWFIGCPKYTGLQPTFLNKDLYRISAPSRLIKL